MSEIMDGYIRVSTRRGRSGPSYITKGVQRAAIERWAEYKGVTIAEWFTDEDQSGGTQNRPGLERAIERALAGETNGLVSYKIDRFSRFTEGGLTDLRRLKERDARLAFVSEDIDTSGQMGKFVYVVMLAMAEYALDTIRAQWVDAKTRAVARGAYISRTPYGYQRRADGSIEPDPAEAAVVTEAYRLAAEEGLTACRAHLQEAVPERRWTLPVTRKFLSRRTYLGETNHGAFHGHTHVAIVPRVLWEAAQRAAQRTGQHVSPRRDYPLTGVVHCAACDQPMVGGRGGRDRRRMYRCAGRSTYRVAACTAGAAVSADALEEYVAQELRANLTPMRALVSASDASGPLADLERELAEADEELAAAEADTALRKRLGDRYHGYMETRIAAFEAAQAALRAFAEAHHVDLLFQSHDLLDRSDPALFGVGVRNLLQSIIVARGRGVEQRVTLVPFDADDASGVATP